MCSSWLVHLILMSAAAARDMASSHVIPRQHVHFNHILFRSNLKGCSCSFVHNCSATSSSCYFADCIFRSSKRVVEGISGNRNVLLLSWVLHVHCLWHCFFLAFGNIGVFRVSYVVRGFCFGFHAVPGRRMTSMFNIQYCRKIPTLKYCNVALHRAVCAAGKQQWWLWQDGCGNCMAVFVLYWEVNNMASCVNSVLMSEFCCHMEVIIISKCHDTALQASTHQQLLF